MRTLRRLLLMILLGLGCNPWLWFLVYVQIKTGGSPL